MIGIWHRSMWLTYAGAAVAAVGLAFAVDGRIRAALACLVLAGVADLLDGAVARRLRRGLENPERLNAYGRQLDALADVVSFVALPVTIVSAMSTRLVWADMSVPVTMWEVSIQADWWQLVVAAAYAVAGVARLAWFNVAQPDGNSSYQGLPVTYAALVIPVLALVGAWFLGPALGAVLSGAVMSGALLLLAVLFLIPARIPKPRGVAIVGLLLLAAAVLVALALV